MRIWQATLLIGICLTPAPQAHGDESAKQPYELVRGLNALQDESTRGNAEAHSRQRQLISQLAQQLVSADAEAWKDPKNVKAAVVYALSGGEPRVLKSLFALRQCLLEALDGQCGGLGDIAFHVRKPPAPRC